MNSAYHTMEINMAIKKNEVDLYVVFRKEVLIYSVEKKAGLSFVGGKPRCLCSHAFTDMDVCVLLKCVEKHLEQHPIEIQCKPHM